MRRPGLILAVALLAASIGCGGPSPTPDDKKKDDKKPAEIDIAGKYNYRASLSDGSEETGTVEVSKSGDTYELAYTRGDKVQYTGVGIRTGDQLSICWSYEGKGERGVGVYTIKDGPKLVGQWATLGGPGKGKTFVDTWTPVKK